MANSITTQRGTTVFLGSHGANCSSDLVVIDHPDAPADLRNLEIGRLAGGGYQPVGADYALSPEVLRAIADLAETNPSFTFENKEA